MRPGPRPRLGRCLRTRGEGLVPPAGTLHASPQGPRINLVTAVRRTLEHELIVNPRMLIFGEDVGRKGGVHAATLGLQEKFGVARVFDTSLSEEGIIGRAVGMAAAGLMPVPEIQFRKYADPAAEQLNDCGSMRWRTANRFAHGGSVRFIDVILRNVRRIEIHASAVFFQKAPAVASYGREPAPHPAHVRQPCSGTLLCDGAQFSYRFPTALDANHGALRGFAVSAWNDPSRISTRPAGCAVCTCAATRTSASGC